MVCRDAHPAIFQVEQNGDWSHARVVPSSGVEHAVMIAARTHIQELQTKIADFLARRTVNQKSDMDTLLNLCLKTKTRSASQVKMKELTKQLEKVLSAQKKVAVNLLTMRGIVAAKKSC